MLTCTLQTAAKVMRLLVFPKFYGDLHPSVPFLLNLVDGTI